MAIRKSGQRMRAPETKNDVQTTAVETIAANKNDFTLGENKSKPSSAGQVRVLASELKSPVLSLGG